MRPRTRTPAPSCSTRSNNAIVHAASSASRDSRPPDFTVLEAKLRRLLYPHLRLRPALRGPKT